MKNIFILIVCLASVFTIGSSVVYEVVWHDNTMTGGGVEDDILKVDTSKIATQYDLISGRVETEISPSQITSDQDNYNPTNWDDATVVRIYSNDIRAITSFAAPTTSMKPSVKKMVNVGNTYGIYIPGEHPDGTSTNRVITDRDVFIYPNEAVTIYYDATSTRWRILAPIVSTNRRSLTYSMAAASVTSGDHAFLGSFNIGTGSSVSGSVSTTAIPAAFALNTGTTTTGNAEAYFAKTVVDFTAFGSAHIWGEALVSIPVLSDATNTFIYRLGITNAASSTSSAATNNSVGIRYSHNVNSGKWEGFSRSNGGSESTADLGVTVAAATLYLLRVECDKARSEARFYIDGVFVGRVTGTMPSAATCGVQNMIIKTASTTSRTLNVHAFSSGAIY